MLLKEFGKSIGKALRAVAKGITNEIERRPEYKKMRDCNLGWLVTLNILQDIRLT